MAITIDINPGEPVLSGNPSYAKVSTNRRILTVGSVSVKTFTINTQLSIGSLGELTWNGDSYTFDVVAVPDDSGFQLPTFNDPTTFQAFIDALSANYYINKDFIVNIVSGGAPFIYNLTARKNGIAYDIVVTESINWGQGVLTNGVDDQIAENFKCVADLYVKQGNDYNLINRIDAGWDDADQARVYLNQMLKALLDPTPPPAFFPGLAIGRWTFERPEMHLYYYVEIREFYGTPPVLKVPTLWGDDQGTKKAVDFTLTPKVFQTQDVATEYYGHTAGTKLITDVNPKLILKNQTDYFCIWLDAGDISDQAISKLDLYFKDGTSSLDNDISNYQFIVARAEGHIEFAMDFSRISTLPLWSKAVAYVEVYMHPTFPGPSWDSEKVRLYIDDQVYENEHYFVFKNRKGGGWSSIGFTGHLKKIMESQRSQAVLGDYSGNKYGDLYAYNQHYKYGFTCETGLWPKRFVEQIVAFSNSEQIYYVDGPWGDEDTELRPIVIDPRGLKGIENTQTTTYSGKFEFTNANREI